MCRPPIRQKLVLPSGAIGFAKRIRWRSRGTCCLRPPPIPVSCSADTPVRVPTPATLTRRQPPPAVATSEARQSIPTVRARGDQESVLPSAAEGPGVSHNANPLNLTPAKQPGAPSFCVLCGKVGNENLDQRTPSTSETAQGQPLPRLNCRPLEKPKGRPASDVSGEPFISEACAARQPNQNLSSRAEPSDSQSESDGGVEGPAVSGPRNQTLNRPCVARTLLSACRCQQHSRRNSRPWQPSKARQCSRERPRLCSRKSREREI